MIVEQKHHSRIHFFLSGDKGERDTVLFFYSALKIEVDCEGGDNEHQDYYCKKSPTVPEGDFCSA